MATDRDWALGYLEQARADFRGMRAMGSVSPSALAMICQMVFEKLAKAALLRQGAASLAAVQGSHRAASRLLLVLRRQRRLVAPLGGTQVWEDVLWVVGALESAHPQLAPAHGPQLEYPWEDVHGAIRWPERDLQVARALGDPRRGLAPRVFRFAELLEQQFDAMFP
ncbi:MAG: hypothetical protein L6Q84_15100 [Polyangiaceae bacterium]|nr:hypothetical protein [Polyangiaceae bacterium]